MIVKELINPDSIVVVGASNDVSKPGGRIFKNLIDGRFDGRLYAVNPKEIQVQVMKCLKHPSELERADLAIIAIASKYIPETIDILIGKGTKAFIILSAGFSETGEEGKKLEEEIVDKINAAGGTLIGPNCIGVLTPRYKGSFAGPIPTLDAKGIDFVSGSGATAVFILETAIPMGLTFASLFSVGNSAQTGVEEVLEFWDNEFDPETSSRVKMIYIEKVDKPDKLLKHARSLINKGCKIAAIKSGTTDAGSRAVSSHTGALAGSDAAVDALFNKAGIIRCFSREELVYVSAVLTQKELTGKNLAVITHAGGPGVILTDILSKKGMSVPKIEGEKAEELLTKLYPGSSVANPIDFLATGTAEQLGIILDYVDNDFDNIDGSVVIFGTPGMFDVTPVYQLLHEKMNSCKKPIFPILPSIIQAKDAIEHFISLGRVNFSEEINLGQSLAKVFHTPKPAKEFDLPKVDKETIRKIIGSSFTSYLAPYNVQKLLDAVGIPRAEEVVALNKEEAVNSANRLGYPVVMKVVGPVHKSDVGGVSLNVSSAENVMSEFERLMQIEGATSVLMQPMLSGRELFAGAKKEPGFGHIILCGLGGIFIEVFKDVATALAPVSRKEALTMIRSLKSYELIEGIRGQAGVDEEKFADIIVKLSALLDAAPEIYEMDLNPLLGKPDAVVAVDARIRVEIEK